MNVTAPAINGFTAEQIRHAKVWAEFYQSKGYQPVPSCSHDKIPMVKYAYAWEGGMPSVDALWKSAPSGNIQVMTGRHWNLCVLDLDGPEGIAKFADLCRERGVKQPKTWTVVNDYKDGRHLWFTIPTSIRRGPDITRLRLWGIWEPEAREGKGAWKKRANIELLCDHSLVMAVPSIHPVKKKKYCWLKYHSPSDMPTPAELPLWILGLKCEEPTKKGTAVPIAVAPKKTVERSGRMPCRPIDVRNAIPSLGYEAAQWGLRIVGTRPNGDGWLDCKDIDREDENPSARFHPLTGRFWSPRFGNKHSSISFFELGVELGIYETWHDCCFDMGRKYLPNLFKKGSHD